MPSKENLTSIFTDIANSIREKSDIKTPIKPVEFAEKIKTDVAGFPKSTAQALESLGIDSNTIFDNEMNEINQNLELSKKLKAEYDTSITDLSDGKLFNKYHYAKEIKYFPDLDFSNLTSYNSIFSYCYMITISKNIKLSTKVSSIYGIFNNCEKLQIVPQFDTSRITNMSSMFRNCRSLTTIPLLNTSNVTDMSYMFYGCSSLIAVPALDVSNVTDMRKMFNDCTSLKEIHMKNINADLELSYAGHYPGDISAYECPLERDALVEVIFNLMPFDTEHLVPSKAIEVSTISKSVDEIAQLISSQACDIPLDEIKKRLNNLPAYFEASSFHGPSTESIVSNLNNAGCTAKEGIFDVPDTPHTLTLGPTLKGKLSDAEIKVATDKGWTVA